MDKCCVDLCTWENVTPDIFNGVQWPAWSDLTVLDSFTGDKNPCQKTRAMQA